LVAIPEAFDFDRDLRVAEKVDSVANEGCTERTTSLERYAMRAAVIHALVDSTEYKTYRLTSFASCGDGHDAKNAPEPQYTK